jgi:hypothetical protein
MEFDEALHAVEIGFSARPHLLESLFRTLRHLETIHCDENHGVFSFGLFDVVVCSIDAAI